MGWQRRRFKAEADKMKRKSLIWLAVIAMAAGAAPVAAQLGGNNGEGFLTAVRAIDGNKATELLDARGSTVLSYRGAKGETALNIVARRRDSTWLGFLLGKGADPNVGDDRGETPLIIAARLGWEDGASRLLGQRAMVDRANKLGETALIAAVQARQPGVVRLLLQNGANPDKKDTAAGYSARDYARRDARSADLLRMIESVRSTKKIIAGPVFR